MTKGRRAIYTGLASLLICIILSSCGKKTGGFEISGTLENVTGNYFFMSHEVGDSLIIDTIPINQKGKFSFKGKVDTLTVISLYFNENTKNTFLLVDKNWDVEMKGDMLYPDLIEVKGGEVNENITDFKNKNKELLKSRADILKEAEQSTRNNDSLPVKDYVVELKNINFELANIAESYIQANPEKIASVMLLNTFFKDEASIARLDECLNLLKGKAIDFPVTADLKSFRDKVKLSSVGSYAPHFSIKNQDGKTIQLTNFRGKYLLLSFAATTCEVCRQEKKDAVAVYKELKKEKKNIEFVSIVKDTEQIPLSKNISDSVKWDILTVEGGWGARIFDSYYVREIPYNILISPTGYILERDIHILALPGKLDEEIAKTDKKGE